MKISLNALAACLITIVISISARAEPADEDSWTYDSNTPTSFQSNGDISNGGTIYINSTMNAEMFNARIKGTLRFPSDEGAYPAIVVLHGCGGVIGYEETHVSHFRNNGYATFVLNSFSARNRNVCHDQNGMGQARYYRVWDADHALQELAKHPRIDAKNISVLGYSNGGHTAMSAAGGHPVFSDKHLDKSVTFASAISLYSWCGDYPLELNTPWLFLGGAKDTAVAPDFCMAWYQNGMWEGQADYQAHVYPNGNHGFIRAGENKEWMFKGKTVSLGGTYAQRDDANRRILAFLKKHRR